MPRIVITGGAGFLGFHLATHLVSRGDTVVLVDNFARGVHDPDLELLTASGQCDLLGLDLESQPLPPLDVDVIVHLAAIVGVKNVLADPYEVLRSNQAMLERVIAFAKKIPSLRNFVFASTSEVYADSVTYGGSSIPTSENSALLVKDVASPRGTYALSKIYGEAMCHASGLPVTIVRPHNIYGPRMGLSHVIPELMNKCWTSPSSESLEVASANHTRTFCYVADASRYLAALVDREGEGRVLNLGRQDPETTILDLAQYVMESMGISKPISVAPDTPGSPARRAPDTQALIQLTGIHPEVELLDGLSKTYHWYREHIFSGMIESAR